MASNPILYVFVNKSLHMTAGKAAAQVAHAVMVTPVGINNSDMADKWAYSVHRTVIVLEARDENHMRNIQKYLDERGIQTVIVIDEGVNEIDPHVPTAMCTGVLDKDNEDVRLAMSSFKLYRDEIEVTIKVPR